MPDFDFAIGSWNVANRHLKTVFTGADDWVTYPSTVTCWSIFDGYGCVDEVIFPTWNRRGMTLRLFDPERKEWSVYWADSSTGQLGPPVTGTFTDGRGDFYGEDTVNGSPVRVHIVWSAITATSAHWEQRFSPDGGRTWESNWVMEFTRA